MTMLVIEFPKPERTLNLNDRLHWSKRSPRAAAWREAAWAYASNRRRHPSWPKEPLGHCRVAISLPVRSLNIRRDAHNWAPTAKAIIDGLVDAGIFPDDSTEHVELLDPRFHTASNFVIVTIHPTGRTHAADL